MTENKVIGKINEYSLHCGFVIAVFVTTLLLVLVTRTPIVINGLEIENSIYKILFGISMLFPTQIYFILGVEKGVMSKYRINYLYSMDKIIEDIS